MDIQLWHRWSTPPSFSRTIQIPDTYVEAHGMPEIIEEFDGLYFRVEKDYGTPAFTRLVEAEPIIEGKHIWTRGH
jgi:hypothetical protein